MITSKNAKATAEKNLRKLEKQIKKEVEALLSTAIVFPIVLVPKHDLFSNLYMGIEELERRGFYVKLDKNDWWPMLYIYLEKPKDEEVKKEEPKKGFWKGLLGC